eukprot:scaffold543_cov312-Prasinococcus_capsulatus_cf.AAC.9
MLAAGDERGSKAMACRRHVGVLGRQRRLARRHSRGEMRRRQVVLSCGGVRGASVAMRRDGVGVRGPEHPLADERRTRVRRRCRLVPPGSSERGAQRAVGRGDVQIAGGAAAGVVRVGDDLLQLLQAPPAQKLLHPRLHFLHAAGLCCRGIGGGCLLRALLLLMMMVRRLKDGLSVRRARGLRRGEVRPTHQPRSDGVEVSEERSTERHPLRARQDHLEASAGRGRRRRRRDVANQVQCAEALPQAPRALQWQRLMPRAQKQHGAADVGHVATEAVTEPAEPQGQSI